AHQGRSVGGGPGLFVRCADEQAPGQRQRREHRARHPQVCRPDYRAPSRQAAQGGTDAVPQHCAAQEPRVDGQGRFGHAGAHYQARDGGAAERRACDWTHWRPGGDRVARGHDSELGQRRADAGPHGPCPGDAVAQVPVGGVPQPAGHPAQQRA
ncbi:hypothetical protein GGF44_003865, partial [Coemansia sp. RSA 1694]